MKHIIDTDELEKLQQYVMIDMTNGVEQCKHGDYVHIDDLRAFIANSPQADGMVLVANEAMKDLARPFLLGLELGIKQFKPMVKHLEMSGAYLPQWFIESEGHLNKMAKAHYIFEAMLSAYKPQADDVRKDAERLDWFDREKPTVHHVLYSSGFKFAVDVSDAKEDKIFEASTIREAIDKARE